MTETPDHRHPEHLENSAMSRINVFRKLRASTVVPAALVGALAVTGLSGLTAGHQASSTGGQVQLVNETVPTDGMSYDLTTGVHKDLAHRYDSIIRDIRGRVRGTPLYGGTVLTRNRTDYFPVTLAMGRNQITLVLDARNLYVVGWRNDGTNVYYRMGAGPATYAGAHPVNLSWLNYSNMEKKAGIGRDSLGISLSSIQGSISDLGNLHSQAAGRDQARAMLILTQAFAEGARFDFISSRVSEAIRGGHSYYPGTTSTISSDGSSSSRFNVTGMDFENNWGGLSDALQAATHNHTAPHYPIGEGFLSTLAAIDAQLAVALWHKF
ncbi:ribosome-inactivating family protein [Streptomyces sp. NPDC054884]|uniref:ribosome-inactivating family protein n=1 Tax=Streptomyces sp. ME08-AFT2 TaxID=3028683 RepID=UPI0029BC7767|nr:ribosome-inactivating family protein [Streptomyces sp. ME08-AFT2]MDX3309171.1 ribosome-inactivating family protein [Streptomyces sp. ME08-AFT2]